MASSRSKKHIRNEVSSTIYSLPWYVARDEGYFADENLDVEFIKAKKGDPKSGSIDPATVNPLIGHAPFKDGDVNLFRACQEGNVRRVQDFSRDGVCGYDAHVTSLQPSRPLHAVITAPGSDIDRPAQLAGRGVGVNFYAGSHFAAIRLLEGFVGRERLKLRHYGGPAERFDAVLNGEVEAAVIMEPYVALTDKLGANVLVQGFFVATDIVRADLDPDDLRALYRALDRASDFLNAAPENKRKYLHYLVADIPQNYPWGTPGEADFHLPRLRFGHTLAYPRNEFDRSLEILTAYDLLAPGATFDGLVDNGALVSA